MARAGYAPNAIVRAGREADKEIAGSTFSGVLGDVRHKYGYHLGRCELPRSDYSVKLSLDKQGPNCAASALDMSFTTAQMKVVTKRLKDSAEDPNDPRMEAVREFYGTLDGRNVFGYTHTSERGSWSRSSSDKSHLWHVHISFFRKYAENYAAIRAVIDVMKGVPYKRTESKPTAKPTTHKVVKGDTLWDIAKKYGTSIAALKASNGLRNDTIYPGQTLRLVAVATPPKPTQKRADAPFELERGDKGQLVRKLQVGLNKVFPAYSRLDRDGDFGPATEKVVKEFQRRAGLTPDGIVGPNTKRALARYGVHL